MIYTGNGIGSYAYVETPASYPANETPCTQAQAATPTAWKVSGGSVVAAPVPVAQQAASLLASGLTITSTSTAALDGTYAADEAAQSRANRIASYVALNGKFPNGATTLDWLDAAGNKHTFPSTAEFQARFTAMGNFVAACEDVIMGFSATLPSASATIV